MTMPSDVATRACPQCGAQYHGGMSYCPADGSPLAPVRPDDLSGLVVGGRYRLLSRMGEGGFGAVYCAEHLTLPRQASVKVLRDPAGVHIGDVERFVNEVQAVAAIDHINIVPVYDAGNDSVVGPYLAMRLLRGEDLSKRLMRNGKPPIQHTFRIIDGVAAALEASHAIGVFHRDVKPANIFLEDDPTDLTGFSVRLLDFGIATAFRPDGGAAAAQRRAERGMAIGSPLTISPEALQGDAVDGRADIYALGVCLFALLTGELPFSGGSDDDLLTRRLFEPPPHPGARVGGRWIPAVLDRLVVEMMARQRDDRPANCRELRARLEAMRGAVGVAWAEHHMVASTSSLEPWQWDTSQQNPAVRPLGMVSSPPARSVVVADDEPAIVELVRLILEDAGYRVRGVVGGRGAVAALAHNPDAFLLDVMMPDIDGVACAEQLRAAGYGGPILVMTTLRSAKLRDDLTVRLDCQMVDKIRELHQLPRLLSALWAGGGAGAGVEDIRRPEG